MTSRRQLLSENTNLTKRLNYLEEDRNKGWEVAEVTEQRLEDTTDALTEYKADTNELRAALARSTESVEALVTRLDNLARIVPALSKYRATRGEVVYGPSGETSVRNHATWNDTLINDTIAALDRKEQADRDAKLIADVGAEEKPKFATGGYTGHSYADGIRPLSEFLAPATVPAGFTSKSQTVQLSEEDRNLLRNLAPVTIRVSDKDIAEAVKPATEGKKAAK